MNKVFETVLYMSVIASYSIMVVLLIRLLLKRFPKKQAGAVEVEPEVKKRIKNVLFYRRPKVWGMALLVLAVAGVSIGLATNAATSKDEETPVGAEEVAERKGEAASEQKESSESLVKAEEGVEEQSVYTALLEYTERYELSEAQITEWYERFLADGISMDENTQLWDFLLQDVNQDGVEDAFLVIWQRDDANLVTSGEIYGYLGEELLYQQKSAEELYFGIEVQSGDVNHDGQVEIIYMANTGGCGGAGSFRKGMLQLQDGRLVETQLPSGFSSAIDGEAGYSVKIYQTGEKHRYRAEMLEADGTVGKTCFFEAAEVTELPLEQAIGNESRGYANFEIVVRDGREYLQAEEYLYAGSQVSGIGTAVFLFDWDEAGNPYVLEFTVEPFMAGASAKDEFSIEQ